MCIRDSLYTAYTQYKAEIDQGRIESLLNFQTMVCDLTKMEIANASLLDESTSAAEAMTMLFANRDREKVNNNCNKFFVADDVFDQTLDVLMTRAEPLGIEIVKNSKNFLFQQLRDTTLLSDKVRING